MELPEVVDVQGNGLANVFLNEHVIKAYASKLEKTKKDKEEVEELMSLVKETLSEVKDADGLTDAFNWAAGLMHVGTSKAQTKKLLADKAKELNVSYDKDAKKFVANE